MAKQNLDQQIHPEVRQPGPGFVLPADAAARIAQIGRALYSEASKQMILPGSDLPVVYDDEETRAHQLPRPEASFAVIGFIPDNAMDFFYNGANPVGSAVEPADITAGIKFVETGPMVYKSNGSSHTFFLTPSPSPHRGRLPIILDRAILSSIEISVDGRSAIDQNDLMYPGATTRYPYPGIGGFKTRISLEAAAPLFNQVGRFVNTEPGRPSGVYTSTFGSKYLYDIYYRNEVSAGDILIIKDVRLNTITNPVSANNPYTFSYGTTEQTGTMILWGRPDRRLTPYQITNGNDSIYRSEIYPSSSDPILYWDAVEDAVRYEVCGYRVMKQWQLQTSSGASATTSFTISAGSVVEPWMDFETYVVNGVTGAERAKVTAVDPVNNIITVDTAITNEGGFLYLRRRAPHHPDFHGHPYGFLNPSNVPDIFHSRIDGTPSDSGINSHLRVLRGMPDFVAIVNHQYTGPTFPRDNVVHGNAFANIGTLAPTAGVPVSSVSVLPTKNYGTCSTTQNSTSLSRVGGPGATWTSGLVNKWMYFPRTGVFSKIVSVPNSSNITLEEPFHKPGSSTEIYWVVDGPNLLPLIGDEDFVVVVKALVNAGDATISGTPMRGHDIYSFFGPYSHPYYVKRDTNGSLTVTPFMFDLTPQSISDSYVSVSYTRMIDHMDSITERISSGLKESDIQALQDFVMSS